MAVQFDTSIPYVLAPGEGEPMSWFAATMALKASAAELGVVELVISPGNEPPLHIHSREDEWFYVLDGEATFHVGGEDHRAPVGTFVSLPRGIPHTFSIESATARLLMLNAPGGFERMFELAPKTVEDAVRALDDYGIDVAGPHPRDAASA